MYLKRTVVLVGLGLELAILISNHMMKFDNFVKPFMKFFDFFVLRRTRKDISQRSESMENMESMEITRMYNFSDFHTIKKQIPLVLYILNGLFLFSLAY